MRLIDADAFDKRLVRLGALSIKSALDEEPTIEAEPVRHGRWIYKPYENDDAVWLYHCSECNAVSALAWNYCRECGAKMDLEVDDG